MAKSIASTLRKLGRGEPDIPEHTREEWAKQAPQADDEASEDETRHDRYRRRQLRMSEGDTSLNVVEAQDVKIKPGQRFEGPVEALIKQYKDPREVMRHMSHGQFMKHELRDGKIYCGEEMIYDGTAELADD